MCVLFFWPLFFSGGVKLSLVSVFSWLIFSFGTAKHVEKKTKNKNKNMNKKKNKEKKPPLSKQGRALVRRERRIRKKNVVHRISKQARTFPPTFYTRARAVAVKKHKVSEERAIRVIYQVQGEKPQKR